MNIEYRTRNFEYRSMASLRSVFFINTKDRIPYLDILHSLFGIRYSMLKITVSFEIQDKIIKEINKCKTGLN
jgi:hypothetical protein